MMLKQNYKKRTLTILLALIFAIVACVGIGWNSNDFIAYGADGDVYSLAVKNVATGTVKTMPMNKDPAVIAYEEYVLTDLGGQLGVTSKSEISMKKNDVIVTGTTKTLEKGTYTVKYSPNRIYISTGQAIDVTRVQNKDLGVFVFASYNKYSKEKPLEGTTIIPNQMKYNESRLEYDEYVLEHIEVEYNDDDFYLQVEDGTTIVAVKDSGSNFEFEGKGIYTIRYVPEPILDNMEKVRIEFESPIAVPETIEIYSVKEFEEFADKARVESYSFKKTVLLQADLDFKDIVFTPIGHFNGTFKGNGNTIKNVKVSGNGSYAGIFRYVGTTGIVKDLFVEADIKMKESQNFLGGIVGSNLGLIENCVFSGEMVGNNSIGGIAGINEFVDVNGDGTKLIYGIIKNCKNKGDIKGFGNIGGIAGSNNGEILNSTNSGKINAVDYLASEETKLLSIGGIVGFDKGVEISGCVNNGVVGFNKIGSFVGGIVGMGVGVIKECVNNGEINGNNYVGGILGYNASFTSEKDRTQITDQLARLLFLNFGIDIGIAGGTDEVQSPELLLKETFSTTGYSINRGKVIGETNVGGVLGYMNTGKNLKASVFGCINEGIVNSNKDNVGGVLGNHGSGELVSCFNTGEVKSNSGSYIGGIAGVSTSDIKSCYAVCDLIGKSYVGGIVGSGTNVTSCYSNATIVSSGEFRGAIAGKLSGRSTFNYYIYSSVDGIDNISYVRSAVRLSVDELASKDKLSQKVIGFESVDWVAGSGKPHYPILRIFDECEQNCENDDIAKMLKDASTLSTLQTLKILFVDENGNHIYSTKVAFNQSLDNLNVPAVPKKEGYYGEWAKYITENVTIDQRVSPIYEKQVTAIASDKTLNPTLFLNGNLHPETVMKVEELPFDVGVAVDGKQVLNKYRVTVTLRGEKLDLTDCTFKVFVPSSISNPKIARTIGGGVEYVDSEMQGSYLMFNADGLTEFIVVYNKPLISWANVLVVALSALGGAGITVVLLLIVRKVKIKKKAKKELKENETNAENCDN